MADVNYTEEMVTKIKAMYEVLGNDGIENIAKEFNKTVPSIRSKLVKECVYVPFNKATRSKSAEPSKKEILRTLETYGINPEGLEGATKTALANLINFLNH